MKLRNLKNVVILFLVGFVFSCTTNNAKCAEYVSIIEYHNIESVLNNIYISNNGVTEILPRIFKFTSLDQNNLFYNLSPSMKTQKGKGIKKIIERLSKGDVVDNGLKKAKKTTIKSSKNAYKKMKKLSKKTPKKKYRTPVNNGKWLGDRGNSKWIPDKNYIPGGGKPYANPKNKTWEQIMKENKIDGIDFKDGIPNFDKVSKMETKIDYKKIPTRAKDKLLQDKPNRDELHEYFYKKLAKEKNMTVEEIKRFKESKNLVPHETTDGRIQLIPREIHDNIVHEGGVSLFRNQLK